MGVGGLMLCAVDSFITLILDTVGRKKPLMFGAGSFVVTYSILTAIVASFPPDQSTNNAAQRAGIAMIFLTSIFFSLSFGPVSWVLASEVCLPRILREDGADGQIGIPHENTVNRNQCGYMCQLGFQRPVFSGELLNS